MTQEQAYDLQERRTRVNDYIHDMLVNLMPDGASVPWDNIAIGKIRDIAREFAMTHKLMTASDFYPQREILFENSTTQQIGVYATCNVCDRIIYADEMKPEEYTKNHGMCFDCHPKEWR